MQIRSLFLRILSIGLFITACGPSPGEPTDATDSNIPVDAVYANLPDANDIVVGHITRKFLSSFLEATGNIEADPNERAMVSPVMKGYLDHIYVHIGEYVNKGQILAKLSHPGYVELQQEFLETRSRFNYLKTDYQRQGELSLEHAASLKTMQKAQIEFESAEAKLRSLESQLSFLGIDADSLTVGKLTKTVFLRAPVSGSVIRIDGYIGMLCPEERPLFQIVGSRNTLVHLNVYERDAAGIQPGQEVRFRMVAKPGKEYGAVITSVAGALDEDKTINVHARIIDRSKDLVPGMFVNAKIMQDQDSVFALPESAVIRKGDSNYVFLVTNDSTFHPAEIRTGKSESGWIELVNPPDEVLKNKVVIEGTYNFSGSIDPSN